MPTTGRSERSISRLGQELKGSRQAGGCLRPYFDGACLHSGIGVRSSDCGGALDQQQWNLVCAGWSDSGFRDSVDREHDLYR